VCGIGQCVCVYSSFCLFMLLCMIVCLMLKHKLISQLESVCESVSQESELNVGALE